MIKIFKAACLSTLALASIFSPVRAHAFFASEITQLLNMAQLIDSNLKQLEMQNSLLKSVETFGAGEWKKSNEILNSLSTTVKGVEALSYAMDDIDAKFRDTYPKYVAPTGAGNFSTQYEKWSHTTMDSVKSALKAAGVQAANFGKEKTTIDDIKNLLNGDPSTVQATQAMGMLAYEQVQQMQKMRQLMMSQLQAYSAHVTKEQGQQDAAKKHTEEHFRPYVSSGTPFVSSGGKN